MSLSDGRWTGDYDHGCSSYVCGGAYCSWWCLSNGDCCCCRYDYGSSGSGIWVWLRRVLNGNHGRWWVAEYRVYYCADGIFSVGWWWD